LTRVGGDAPLTGPEPRTHEGTRELAPSDSYGHDHLYWLDRMVRSEHPLVERLALVFHDWFATNDENVGSQRLMLDQTNLFRAHGLGSFRDLVVAITRDPAMILFLDQDQNRRGAVNENYARELMELFTLGADRGAYTEQDVRELARSLTGWRTTWSAELGHHDFRWDAGRWDAGTKTVFGQTGAWGWEDACRLVVDHPLHASFFVAKLWSYFVAGAVPAATAAQLEALYVSSGHQIRPVVEAILMHPLFYSGAAMVKPPVVAMAGMFRARGRFITENHWWWISQNAGQRLYYPPDVAGWRDDEWLDTGTVRYRFEAVHYHLEGDTESPKWNAPYQSETAQEAVARAAAFWGARLSDATRSALEAWAQDAIAANANSGVRAQRQNALRHLVGVSPDFQTS